ncbi:adenylate kinase [bacterium]|nr:adenylate kinase [bacterium]
MRKIFILLGPPGAGKGSVGEVISEILEMPLISTGDLLRKHENEGTPLGIKAKAFMDSGELVPDEIVIKMLKERISKDNCKEGFILDGFPRTLTQAEMLDNLIKEDDEVNVFYLKAEDDFLVNRLSNRRVCESCGKIYHLVNHPPIKEGVCDICKGKVVQRKDDTEEVIRKRLGIYKTLTAPLIDYYKNKGYFHIVDGETNVDFMMDEIRKIMKW